MKDTAIAFPVSNKVVDLFIFFSAVALVLVHGHIPMQSMHGFNINQPHHLF